MKKVTMLMMCALALPVVAMAESGTILRATQLVAEPYADATSRGVLRGDSVVDILERDGGWYRVKTNDRREGWVRLSNVRLGEAAEEEEGGFWASVFSFTGRSETRTASATTGIRGLSEEEIRDATPDNAAVMRLAQFAPDDTETRQFAADIGLKSRDVKPLPEKAPAKGGAK